MDFSGELGYHGHQVNAALRTVIPRIGFGIGSDFGDQALDVEVLGIVRQNFV